MAEKLIKEQEVQRKYVELQLLEKQVKTLHAQVQQIEQQVADVDEISTALHQLSEVGAGTDILIPLSAGIFFRGTLTDAKKVLVNVGFGSLVPKSADDTCKDLQEQLTHMRRMQEDRMTKLQELAAYAQRVQEDLAKLVEEAHV
ncbi:MAG: prefoldin subunit alpha [Candidatus Aenigmarchaeota archaeon]|nr:prefoldin subunit alpha [Candidatus Aenigmarchaeota archaeon]